MAVWSLREMVFLLRWARIYQGARAHVERGDWTSGWAGREVLVSGSLIGGGSRADMRHLLLWPPLVRQPVWRLWRRPPALERLLARCLESLSVEMLRFSFPESCLLHCLVHSKRCTDHMQ